MSATTRNSPAVFFSLSAQSDNLGDIEIRRVMLDWLRSSGCPLRIFVGRMPKGYLDSFDLSGDVETFDSSLRFQWRLAQCLLRREAHLAFAPGPQTFARPGGRRLGRSVAYLRTAIKPAINFGNTLAVRACGGRVISIGRAVRGDHELALRFERSRAGLSSVYSVRDSSSSEVLGKSVTIIPDLAFLNTEVTAQDQVQDLVILSLRGDRPVDHGKVDSAVRVVRSHGLEPVFLTQVRSDNANHVLLGKALGCRVIAWDAQSHTEQLEIVKETYQRAAMVISDRLHALIFGAQSGADLVAVVQPGNDKLTSTLGHVVPLNTLTEQDHDWSEVTSRSLTHPRREQTMAASMKGRQQLERMSRDVIALLKHDAVHGR